MWVSHSPNHSHHWESPACPETGSQPGQGSYWHPGLAFTEVSGNWWDQVGHLTAAPSIVNCEYLIIWPPDFSPHPARLVHFMSRTGPKTVLLCHKDTAQGMQNTFVGSLGNKDKRSFLCMKAAPHRTFPCM